MDFWNPSHFLKRQQTFLDNKVCTFKIILSWHQKKKTAFWAIFLSARNPPPSTPQSLFLLSSRRLCFILCGCRARKISPKFFCLEIFLRPARVMDVCAFGSRASEQKTLFSCAPSDGDKVLARDVHLNWGSPNPLHLKAGHLRSHFSAHGAVWTALSLSRALSLWNCLRKSSEYRHVECEFHRELPFSDVPL